VTEKEQAGSRQPADPLVPSGSTLADSDGAGDYQNDDQATTSGDTLDARSYARRGWRVFPLKSDTLTPEIREWQHRADTYAETLYHWSRKWPDAKVGIATGAQSNLVVIDVDVPDGEATLAKLEAEHGELPQTREVSTPSGGRHLYFRHPGGYVKCSASKLGADLDVRGDGGYIVAYRYANDAEPAELAAPWAALLQREAPQAKITAPDGAGLGPTTGYGAAALDDEAAKVARTEEGNRNDRLNDAAFRMGQLARDGG
jgi:bifunctional DNA primase/polymerase-like protein